MDHPRATDIGGGPAKATTRRRAGRTAHAGAAAAHRARRGGSPRARRRPAATSRPRAWTRTSEAGPRRDALEQRPPRGLLPRAEPEHPARRRRDAGERVGEVAVPPRQQLYDAAPGLGPAPPRGRSRGRPAPARARGRRARPSATTRSARPGRPPGPTSAAPPCRPPSAQPAGRVALVLRVRERVLAVDRHGRERSRPDHPPYPDTCDRTDSQVRSPDGRQHSVGRNP